MKNPVSIFRIVALCEAASFLILLGIAMPLKYIWHLPQAVKIVGMLHGVLFVVFCITLGIAKLSAKWPMKRAAMLFAISFVPILPFLFDRKLREWAAEAGENVKTAT